VAWFSLGHGVYGIGSVYVGVGVSSEFMQHNFMLQYLHCEFALQILQSSDLMSINSFMCAKTISFLIAGIISNTIFQYCC